MTMMFVALPVTDLDRATAFYTAIGFTLNPAFSDHNAACFVVEEDHSALMVITREYFQTFTDLPIGDPSKSPTSSVSVFVDSRDEVDARAKKGLEAGGTEPREPSDYGFMYQRGITDPDGNSVEFGWMDPKAAAEGPPADVAHTA